MKITEVRIGLPKTEIEHIAAFVAITIDGCFVIHNVRVVRGAEGLFVAMPSTKTKDGFKDVCHPINKETREEINKAVMEAYEKAVSEAADAEK